jgi:hypothetical protein
MPSKEAPENPFEGLDKMRRKEACDFGAARLALDDVMRGYLDEALANKKISDAKIAATFTQVQSRRFAASTLRRHRAGQCACFD